MKKIFVFALLALSISCSSSSDDKKSNNFSNGSNGGQGEQKDTTDYSACGRGTPTQDIRGVWMHSLESEGFRAQMILEISDDNTWASNVCESQGRRLTASARASSTFDAATYTVLSPAEDEKRMEDGDFHMNCNVSLKPMKMKYTFKGSCLVMSAPNSNESLTLVPAR